ncbi:NUDIX domain-containing protein [Rhodococcus sp. X156]|uniref:NUDIX hydrolase n=1 Tax=Rhodococcus sp. X156 TaxID=2499145 RepID=UPI000FDB2C25|nr:NUDIX domain-containing protein [Rhodococcus sp. X156]
MSTWTLLLVVALVVLVALAALWSYGTAHRLDRLHVRLDSAWIALEAALSRRAVVARSVALAVPPGARVDGRRLTSLAAGAERTDRERRETVENALSVALDQVPVDQLSPQLAAELADAQTRVLLARRFYNDAVRDTQALRSRRLVRWFRLGGTAPQPRYFEIAEAEVADATAPPQRPAARVLLLDPDGRVLMLRGASTTAPDTHYWITTGGGLEPGESLVEAGVREVAEETGHRLDVAALRGPLWWRRTVLELEGRTVEAAETYFAACVPPFLPHTDGYTELEQRVFAQPRWCTPEELVELEGRGEQVYPPGLPALLPEALAAAAAGPDAPGPVLRRIP